MTTAILDLRPTARAASTPAGATTDFIRLLGLDRPPARRLLACAWRRDEEGRLCCRWEARPAPGRGGDRHDGEDR